MLLQAVQRPARRRQRRRHQGILQDHLRVPSPQDHSQEPKDNEGAAHNIATSHASGEEVVGAIIDRNKRKAKQGDTTIGEGRSDCFQKKETGRCPGACSSSRLSAWADDPPTAIRPTSLKRSSRDRSRYMHTTSSMPTRTAPSSGGSWLGDRSMEDRRSRERPLARPREGAQLPRDGRMHLSVREADRTPIPSVLRMVTVDEGLHRLFLIPTQLRSPFDHAVFSPLQHN